MPEADKLTPADPSDLAAALAFALRYQGRKRVHNADEIMAEIVAKMSVIAFSDAVKSELFEGLPGSASRAL